MQYEIFGNMMPGVTVTLEQGEEIYTQSGGMSWMSDGISMDTNMKGGFMKGLGRMFAGESLFMATYRAMRPGARITFAATVPGRILDLPIAPGKDYIAQKDAFLCAQPGVHLETVFSRKLSSGAFGGEGFILQKFSGSGVAFLELDGTICEYQLAPGEVVKVDTGNVALFEASVGYSVESVKGFKNVLFGGEGLFLTVLTGPGHIWLQTMTTSELAKKIVPYLPTTGD